MASASTHTRPTVRVAVAAVLGSLFAAFAVVGAAILFGERMNRGQWFGVAMIVVGVAVLAAVRG